MLLVMMQGEMDATFGTIVPSAINGIQMNEGLLHANGNALHAIPYKLIVHKARDGIIG